MKTRGDHPSSNGSAVDCVKMLALHLVSLLTAG